jgi:dolichol-phosphate mannosyltransferase
VVNLSVIVPFYNEEELLEESVNRLLDSNIFDVIYLINNNSTDKSYEIGKKLEINNSNVKLFQTSSKKGKGVALSFSRKMIDTSHVIIHDADLEYFPDDIPQMFEAAKQNIDSLILGTRFNGDKNRENIYMRTYFANRFMSLFFSFINFYKVSDVATCYKLMPSIFFKNIDLKENGFSVEIELLSKFLKFNRSIIEVPIKYEGRSYAEGKKIKAIDGFRYLFATVKYKFLD